MSFLTELPSQRVLVVGAGVTGEGLLKYLNHIGVSDITILDEKAKSAAGAQVISSLNETNFDLAIVSPGWKLSHPAIEALKTAGVSILGEIDFAWKIKEEIAPAQKWIALTGTNGKTTTVQMVESILHAADIHGIACGNVGTTVIEALMNEKPFDLLALELSSFQIEWSTTAQFESVAILNIADDHIDWHGSFENYAATKLSLLHRTQVGILNLNDPEVALRASAWNGKKVFFGLDTPAENEIGLVENLLIDRAFSADAQSAEVIAELVDINPSVPHNVMNAMAAAGLALSTGISHADIKKGLAQFKPDHHRLELVLEANEISWVDDSKATNPHAALAALGSYLSVVWIAGGLAKGARMDSLIKRAASRVKSAILIGEDRELIAEAIAEFAPDITVHLVDKTGTAQELMDDVVAKAKEVAQPGDTVLLAPACASMDQFTSYAQRGDFFAASVKRAHS